MCKDTSSHYEKKSVIILTVAEQAFAKHMPIHDFLKKPNSLK